MNVTFVIFLSSFANDKFNTKYVILVIFNLDGYKHRHETFGLELSMSLVHSY